MARDKSKAEAPRPAPILETDAMTSKGPAVLSPAESLAYSLHRAADLASRLNLLEAVSDDEVLVKAGTLLCKDGAQALADAVTERLNALRDQRANDAGVERQEERRGVLWSGERELLTLLTAREHAEARVESVAAAQRWLEAVAEEKARATAAKAEIGELEALHRAAQRVAHTGEDYRTQQVEIVVQGARVITRRLDTGAVLEERDATASEIERASQVRLWGER